MGLTRLNQFVALLLAFFIGIAPVCAQPSPTTTPTTTLQNDFEVTGNTWCDANLTVTGTETVTGTATHSGNSVTTGNESVGGNLAVTGTSALTGVATFTAQPVFTSPLLSANIDPSLIQLAAVTVNTAGVTGMFAAPFQLIAAPGAGKSIVVHRSMIRVIAGGTQFASGGVVAPQIGATVHGGGTLVSTTLPAATVNAASSSDTELDDTGANITLTQNTGVFLSNATGAFTTGNGSLVVFIWYSIE